VLVRVHQPDAETWGIEVIDTGPGIPQEALAHIFDPFWQADGTVTREHGGVGLGLSISKQLVSLMGGRVEVQSKVGHGTRFNVVFPLKSAKEQQREEAAGVSH
jgi:signal transduction histidine kinase